MGTSVANTNNWLEGKKVLKQGGAGGGGGGGIDKQSILFQYTLIN